MSKWNSTSLLSSHCNCPLDITLTLGSWGCGALCGPNWFQYAWCDDWAEVSIACKEFVPIVMGLELWGDPLKRKAY